MYNFPHEGETLEQCVDILKKDYESNNLSANSILCAIESLRDSPENMRSYFKTFSDICEEYIKEKIETGQETLPGDISIKKTAELRAYEGLRRIINHYSTEEIHIKWNAALPELKMAGGLATLF